MKTSVEAAAGQYPSGATTSSLALDADSEREAYEL
jgi:hypothetical protein